MNDPGRTKKIIYAALGFCVLLLAAFLAFRYFSSPPGTPVAPPKTVSGRLPGFSGEEQGSVSSETSPAGSATGNTGSPAEKLLQVTDFPVIGPTFSKEGDKILYYKKDGGDLFSSPLAGGDREKISNFTVVGLIQALWSATKDRAALFYLDQDTLRGFVHVGTSSTAILPQDVKSFSWSPDGKSLAYLLEKDGKMNLVVAGASGKGSRIIFTTLLRDASISWVTADKIAFQTAPSGLAEGYLFMFSRSTGSFTRLAGPLFGLSSLWSPDGTRVLVSATDPAGKRPRLAVIDAAGKITFLRVSTLAQKCAWATNDSFYCAVPQQISPDTVWPDDYLRGDIHSTDRIELVAFEKNEIIKVFSGGILDISDLRVSKDKNYLIFVNRFDGSLWRLRLN